MTFTFPGDPANIWLSYHQDRSILPAPLSNWTVTASVDSSILVGKIELTIVDLWRHPRPFDDFDALSEDHSALAGVVLQISGDGLRDGLQADLDATSKSTIMFLDRVELGTAWRGSGWLGALLTGLAIEELGSDVGLVFAMAQPFIKSELAKSEMKAAKRKLRTMWKQLGFERYSNDVMVLDLSRTPFEDSLTILKKNLV